MIDFDAQFAQSAESSFRMTLAGLAIALLMVSNPLGDLPIVFLSGWWREVLCGDPYVYSTTNLLDGEVETVWRFFL